MTPRLILASGSPRRRKLLASLEMDFDIVKPDVDEIRRPGESPLDYVRRLSQLKAETVIAQQSSPAAVLAADTIVVLAADTIGIDEDGDILGKPVDADDARQMLRRLRGRDHLVCTAFTLMRRGDSDSMITNDVATTVTMRDYSDTEIETYLASGDPFDKAGSYAIQNAAFDPVDHIQGCYTNVVGLPLCAVRRALAKIDWPGITAPEASPTCDCPLFDGISV